MKNKLFILFAVVSCNFAFANIGKTLLELLQGDDAEKIHVIAGYQGAIDNVQEAQDRIAGVGLSVQYINWAEEWLDWAEGLLNYQVNSIVSGKLSVVSAQEKLEEFYNKKRFVELMTACEVERAAAEDFIDKAKVIVEKAGTAPVTEEEEGSFISNLFSNPFEDLQEEASAEAKRFGRGALASIEFAVTKGNRDM